MFAAMCNNVEAIKLLLERGAILNNKDDQGKTALMYLMKSKDCNKADAANLIIAAMSPKDVALRDEKGKIALSYFFEKNDLKEEDGLAIAEMFIDKFGNEDWHKIDRDRKMPFQYLLEREIRPADVQVAQMFIDKMSAAEARLYLPYAKRKKKLGMNNAGSRLIRSLKDHTISRRSRMNSMESMMGEDLHKNGSNNTRERKLQKESTPRGQIIEALEKKTRGSLMW